MGGDSVIMKLNSRGLTLVEVLAVVVISTIIMITIASVLSNSSNTHVKQKEDSKQLYDTSYALKILTKDIRKSTSLSHTGGDFNFQPVTTGSSNIIYAYDALAHTVLRNNIPIAKDVACFNIVTAVTTDTGCIPSDKLPLFSNSTIDEVYIYMESLNGHVVNTSLFFRKG